MRWIAYRVVTAAVVVVLLLILAAGALVFTDAPARQIAHELWMVLGYWWRWPEGNRRRGLTTDKHR